MVRLIAQHGVVGACVPLAIRLALKVTLTDQRLLNFLGTFRLQVDARHSLVAG